MALLKASRGKMDRNALDPATTRRPGNVHDARDADGCMAAAATVNVSGHSAGTNRFSPTSAAKFPARRGTKEMVQAWGSSPMLAATSVTYLLLPSLPFTENVKDSEARTAAAARTFRGMAWMTAVSPAV